MRSCYPVYKNLEQHPGMFVARRFETNISTGDEIISSSIDTVRVWIKNSARQHNHTPPQRAIEKSPRSNIFEYWY
jgi:hypothetical protein